MITHADDDRGLLPEVEREELDELVGPRVEQERPGREEDLVEGLEQLVERDQRDDPERDDRRRPGPERRCRPPARCAPGRAGGSPRPARRSRSAARIHSPRKTVRTSAMCARSRASRTGWPLTWTSKCAAEDEVGQDRVGGGAQLLGRVAGPRGRLRAALLEGDPLRGQERQDRDGDDDDRGREAGEERGDAGPPMAFTRSS